MIDSGHVRLDRDRPLQAQIVAGLRDAIASGRVAAHDRLPGTRTLAAQLGVSRTTVALAIDALIAEGYVVAWLRFGVFVVFDPPRVARSAKPAVAAAAGRKIRLSRLARTHQVVPPSESRSRPLAFPLSRPALDAFPIDTWSRLLSRRAARTSIAQLDYGGGLPQLARAIAALVSAGRGVRVDPAQVMIVGGGQRAIELAAAAIVDPGDRVGIEDPGYPGARSAFAAAGAEVVPVGVDAEGLDVAALPRGARLASVPPAWRIAHGLARARLWLGTAAADPRRDGGRRRGCASLMPYVRHREVASNSRGSTRHLPAAAVQDHDACIPHLPCGERSQRRLRCVPSHSARRRRYATAHRERPGVRDVRAWRLVRGRCAGQLG